MRQARIKIAGVFLSLAGSQPLLGLPLSGF
jgi:hypothetical protein